MTLRKLLRAVALDPTFQGAHDMLSRAQSARGDNLPAVETALNGISTRRRGIAACEKSLAFDPESRQARDWVETLRARVKEVNE